MSTYSTVMSFLADGDENDRNAAGDANGVLGIKVGLDTSFAGALRVLTVVERLQRECRARKVWAGSLEESGQVGVVGELLDEARDTELAG